MVYIRKEDDRFVIYNGRIRVNSFKTLNMAKKAAKRLFPYDRISS